MNEQYCYPICKVTDKSTGTEYYGYKNNKGELYYVRFVNGSKPEDVYAVVISNGVASDCECASHNVGKNPECKHMKAENRVQEAYAIIHGKPAKVKAATPVAKVKKTATKKTTKPATKKKVEEPVKGNFHGRNGFTLLKQAG